MHSSVGIVPGRSNRTNGMIFWDPVTQRMNVSADYKLDPDASIGIHFPTVVYDGQISPMALRGGKNANKEPFPPGLAVQVAIDGDYFQGTVKSVPIGPEIPKYQISPFHQLPRQSRCPPSPAVRTRQTRLPPRQSGLR
jgi:hypothetical protein